jgi:hypothetical protein
MPRRPEYSVVGMSAPERRQRWPLRRLRCLLFGHGATVEIWPLSQRWLIVEGRGIYPDPPLVEADRRWECYRCRAQRPRPEKKP